ncbi:MAG: HAD hydrolase-like protein [Patescibacteria group bacterium]
MKPIAIFDFDGVILDSFEEGFRIRKTITPHITRDEYLAIYDQNVFRSCELEGFGDREVDAFMEQYRISIMHIAFFPLLPQIIEELAGEYQLHIISSTYTDIIHSKLAHHGLDRFFTSVLGGDFEKSKIKKFEHLRSFSDASFEDDMIFITDTVGDLVEADYHKIPSCAVHWGFHSTDTLLATSAAFHAYQPSELLQIVDKNFSRIKNPG